MSDASSAIKMGRRIDASALAGFSLYIPSMLYGFLAMGLVTGIIGGIPGLIVLIAWLAAGVALLFYRPAETLLAKVMGLKEPLAAENEKIQASWQAVTAAAGADASRYILRVEPSKGINALAAAGHVVAVTQGALARLDQDQLTGVLAHELGHHLKGHSEVSILGFWYSLPGRLLNRAFRIAFSVAVAVVDFIGDVAEDGVALKLAALPFFLFGLVIALFAGLLAALIAIPQSFAARRGELRADRVAAELGFKPQIVSGLMALREEELSMTDRSKSGRGLTAAPKRLLERIYATHPPLDFRIRQLEQLAGQVSS